MMPKLFISNRTIPGSKSALNGRVSPVSVVSETSLTPWAAYPCSYLFTLYTSLNN